jgi:hypothetical protein
MEEFSKALGPWPILQFIFGAAVLFGGIYVMMKGLKKQPSDGDSPAQIQDQRAQWEAYRQLTNIEHNTYQMIEILKQQEQSFERIADLIKAVHEALWKRGGA